MERAEPRLARRDRRSLGAHAHGELVDLRNLVKVEKGASAATITRTDRQRSVTVMANLDGISLDEAVARRPDDRGGDPASEPRAAAHR
jgi:multidrug efflux pump subunit AcrB